MLEVDFHTHTFYSNCGIHTHLELLAEANRRGIKVMAITDHGPAIHGRVNSVFYDRFHNPFPAVKLLKGMESNLTEALGAIDVPRNLLKWMDVVLLGIHPNTGANLGKEEYTRRLCAAMKANPFVDIITHPNDPNFPVDFNKVAACAASFGMALELNNSKTLLKRTSHEITCALVKACVTEGCQIAIASDTHAITELGRNEAVLPYLSEFSVPENLVVTRNAEAALRFIEDRRHNKLPAV
jgi:putative hydrolase